MNKITKAVFLLLLTVLILVKPKNVQAVPSVLINELSPNSSSPWIELLNPNTEFKNLSGWTILNSQGTVLVNLSGNLPRQGLLTFTISGIIDANGDCLILSSSSSIINTVYAVKWGLGTCPSQIPNEAIGSVADNPNSDQSIAMISQSWQITNNPTKGWCNDSTGGCPTVSQIIAAINSQGVKTNLGQQEDFSRMTGLYFQKSVNSDPEGFPLGKIEFLAEMNLTDQDALSWLATLETKLNITKGVISLDADLIKNITNTHARLTMYDLSLVNPEIEVINTDGSPGDSSIVTNLNYNGGVLTFEAAHFTTFKAKEKSTSTHYSSPVISTTGVPSCPDLSPHNSPDLFEIAVTKDQATLYFTPVAGPVSYYYIAYGLSEGDERYGVWFPFGYYTGVISFTIEKLSPNTVYYFKVRGGNGCAPGFWSDWLKAKTTNSSLKNNFYKYH